MMAGDRIEITPEKSAGAPIEIDYSHETGARNMEHFLVHAGDTVQVMRADVVYVLGSVNRPGGYIMQENGRLSVLQAIAIAGGTSVVASLGSVYIIRKGRDNSTVLFELPYKKMTRAKVPDVQLAADDILYIPTSRFKATLTSTQGIVASAAGASIYAAAIY